MYNYQIDDSLEAHSAWYEKIASNINSYRTTMSQRDFKKYKLDQLLRIARKVDDFSGYCTQCNELQPEITRLTQNLGNLTQVATQVERKSYLTAIGNMVKHLQKEHKLAAEGQYVGIGMAIGGGIGTALGAFLDNAGIGTAIGIAIGLAVGTYLDRKAKREGKVI